MHCLTTTPLVFLANCLMLHTWRKAVGRLPHSSPSCNASGDAAIILQLRSSSSKPRPVYQAHTEEGCSTPESAASAQLLPAPWQQPSSWPPHLRHPPPSLCHPVSPSSGICMSHFINQLPCCKAGAHEWHDNVCVTSSSPWHSLLRSRTYTACPFSCLIAW